MEKDFKHKITLAIIGLIGTVTIIVLINQYGIGLTPDSVYYISVARHIADGSGFVGYDGYSLVLEPPLYPFLLADIKILFNIDPLISSGYLNAILLGLIIYYSGLLFSRHLKSLSLTMIGIASILILFILLKIFMNALSEPLFIMLIILYLYYIDIYRIKKTYPLLIIISIIASLASLTRYVGVIVILTGAISIFIFGRENFKQMLKHLSLFMILTILPISLWILRNYFTTGTLAGQRAGSSYNLSENMMFFFNTILNWFLPAQINYQPFVLLIVIIFISIIVGIVLSNKEKLNVVRLNKFIPVLIFLILYSSLIIISSTTTAYDKIADRILSPIFIPIIFVMFLVLEKLINWISKYLNQRLVSFLFLIGIIVWTLYPASVIVYYIKDYIEQSGWGYGSKVWKDNSVISYLNNDKKLEIGNSFYSNVPEVTYILANIETRWSPFKRYYNSPQLMDINFNIKSFSQKKNQTYLVWFNDMDRTSLFTIDELQKNTKMVKVAQLKDGEVYTISDK